MRARNAILQRLILMALDGGLLIASLWGSWQVRFGTGLIAAPKGVPPVADYQPSFLFVLLLSFLLFEAHGLYRRRVLLGRLDEMLLVTRSLALAFLAMMAATFLYREISFSRLWLATSWAVAVVAVCAGRMAARRTETWLYRRGRAVRRVAIVGAGEMGREIYRKLERRPGLGLAPAGFLLAGTPAPEGPLPAPVLGDLAALESVAREHRIALIVLTELPSRRDAMLDLVARCADAEVGCAFVPDMFALMSSGARVQELDGVPLITLRRVSFSPASRAVKRAMDLAGSAAGLVLLAPAFGLIALAVRLGSPGPVIFRQKRVGLDGRLFTMYKFRSMRTDAETASGAVWAREEDPRATRAGRFLRRTSLDELPQLVNVLRGEMSLVGPRPERESFVRLFEGTVPRYLERLRVKSGVTGWAQVNGLRGNTSIEARTMHDIYYVENWSPALDLKILLLTVGHLVSRLRRGSPAAAPAETEPERVARLRAFEAALLDDIAGASARGAAAAEARRPPVARRSAPPGTTPELERKA